VVAGADTAGPPCALTNDSRSVAWLRACGQALGDPLGDLGIAGDQWQEFRAHRRPGGGRLVGAAVGDQALGDLGRGDAGDELESVGLLVAHRIGGRIPGRVAAEDQLLTADVAFDPVWAGGDRTAAVQLLGVLVRGHRRRSVVVRQAMRVAITPVVTMAGLDVGALLGGAVIVEVVSGLPGLESMSVQATHELNLPVVMATVLLAALFVVVLNLLVDVCYGLMDPRARR
jgi:hypothetical protein